MEFDQTFYDNLNKPSFQPPQWMFKVVWPILYILMGVSLFIVGKSAPNELKALSIVIFLVQLILNLSWMPIFFTLHRIREALFVSILLTCSVFLMIIIFSQISLGAALLQIPYMLWLIFATFLNSSIVKLNPKY